jgi:hypothetical protein
MPSPHAEVADSLVRWLASEEMQTGEGWLLSWINPGHPGYPYEEISAYGLRLLSAWPGDAGARADECRRRLAGALQRALCEKGSLGRGGTEYVFDTAMGVAALVSALRAGQDVDRGALHRGLAFVQEGLRARRAAWREGEWLPGDRWSTRYAPHLLKCVIALEDAREAGSPVETDPHALAADLLPFQRPDGAFGLPDEAHVDTHVHAYALEGLLRLGGPSGGYAEALRRGVEWLARTQNPDGGSPRRVDAQPGLSMSDVTAQAARLFQLVDAERHGGAAARSLAYLGEMREGDGGIRYHAGSGDVNAWSTIFAAQAFLLAAGEGLPEGVV